MLICDNLACTSWGRVLFKGLGFCLLPGSLLTITGDARAQAALFAALAGAKAPRRGEVRYEGARLIPSLPALHIAAGNNLAPSLSIEASLKLFAAPYRMEKLVPAALRFFGLDRHAGSHCGALSPDLQRRAELAKLLILPCPVWLLDHPEKDLGEESRALLYGLIANRCNQDGTAILATDTPNAVSTSLTLDLKDFR